MRGRFDSTLCLSLSVSLSVSLSLSLSLSLCLSLSISFSLNSIVLTPVVSGFVELAKKGHSVWIVLSP